MNTGSGNAISSVGVHLCASLMVLIFACSCSGPNAANITLRKENQQLRDKVEQLEQARLADAATIRTLEQQKGKLPTLPHDRLEKLFTTHGIEIGRLSGGGKINPDSAADDCIKVHVAPLDQDGDAMKAAGSMVIDAFDLNDPEQRHVGHWEFSAEELRKCWVGTLLMYNYVVTCPLREPPRHPQITVNATFTDELTQRTFTAQRVVNITLPPANVAPTTGSSTTPVAPVTER